MERIDRFEWIDRVDRLAKSGRLVWETEKPLYGVDRKSASFWCGGHPFSFSLKLHAARYKITLHKITSNLLLNDPLEVTVYVRNSRKGNGLCQTTEVTRAGQAVFFRDAKSVDTAFYQEKSDSDEKWTITFLLKCDEPLLLFLGVKEPGQTPLLLLPSENETELSPSEHRCVEACSAIPEKLKSDFRKLVEPKIIRRPISDIRSFLAARSKLVADRFRKMEEIGEAESFALLLYSGRTQVLYDGTASSLAEVIEMQAREKHISESLERRLAAKGFIRARM